MASKAGSKPGKKQGAENSPSLSEPTQDSSSAPTETATVSSVQTKTVQQTKEPRHMTEDTTGIMEYSSDLNDAEAPPPLPAGEYPAEIVKAEIRLSQKGNNYLALMFRVNPESYPADFVDGNPEGETLSYNRLVIQDTPQGRYRMRRFLEAVGAKLGRSIDPNELMGLTATVGIVHGKWEGEDRAEIAKVTVA